MAKIISLAVNPQSVETQNLKSTRYEHTVNGFIVDGDYILVRYNKRTWRTTREQVLSEVVPPFLVPEERLGVPVLIDADSPMYVWIKKPGHRHPCWLTGEGAVQTIVSMVTGETLGRTISPPGLELVGGFDNGTDGWKQIRDYIKSVWQARGINIAEFVGPGEKSLIITDIPNHAYWCSIAHGNSLALSLNSGGDVTGEVVSTLDVALALKNKPPYVFVTILSCKAMNDPEGIMSWPKVFTKDKNTSVVVGFKNMGVDTPPGVVPACFNFAMRLHYYVGIGAYVNAAYEQALTDYPLSNGYVDIYQGKSSVAQEPQNVITGVSPVGSGNITPASGLYSATTINIYATASSGYVFDRLELGSSEGVLLVTTASPSYKLFLSGDMGVVTVTAYFRPVSQPTQVTLTMRVSPGGGGTTSPPVGSSIRETGTALPFSAVHNAGYEFVSWTIERTSTGTLWDYPTGQIIIDDNITMTANFRLISALSVNYTIKANPSSGGTTIPAPGTYTTTGPINLNAVPATGYKFIRWDFIINNTVAESATSSSFQATFDINNIISQFGNDPIIVLSAQFESTTPTDNVKLTLAVSPAGSGTTLPAIGIHSYPSWSTPTVNACPNAGYEFDHWYFVQSNGSHGSYPVSEVDTVLNLDTVATAFFKKSSVAVYSLLVSVNPQNGGTLNSSGGSYNSGASISIVATQTPGYVFDHWSGDATGTSPTLNVTITRNLNIVANFRLVTAKTCTLTVSIVGSGTVVPNGGTFYKDANIALQAQPMVDWRFALWNGANNNSINPTSIMMDADKTVTVTFTRIAPLHSLTTQVIPSGSGTVAPVNGTYSDGSIVSLLATPNSGYVFDHWSGDISGVLNPLSIQITMDMNITANFRSVAAQTYTLTTIVSGSGSLSPSGGTFGEGQVVPITATPSSEWKFSSWTGTDNDAVNPTNVTMNMDKQVTAVFTKTEEVSTPVLSLMIGSMIMMSMMAAMMGMVKGK